MLAHLLVKNGSSADSFEVRDIPIPEVNAGQVRIKVSAFGLNYADVMARQGLYRECPPLPCVIGYDVEGVVDAVGQGVTSFKPGDPVFALTRFGGYAQYATTQAEAVGHLPAGTSTGKGCALATQYVTAYHAAIHCQTIMPGEKVLIHAAAGGLGTALIQIALWKGATVIGVAGGHEKGQYLKSLGVQHVIDHQQTDYMQYVKDQFNGRVDVVFDNIGGSSVRKKGIFNLLRLVVGFGFFSPIGFLSKSQSLIGVNMLKIADHRADIISHGFQEVQDLFAKGILKPHVGKVFSQSDLSKAHDWMEDRKSIGKIAVTWSES